MLGLMKIDTVFLIIVRFSIRNHRWNAQNPSFLSVYSDMNLLERPAPLLGRLRYSVLLMVVIIYPHLQGLRQSAKLKFPDIDCHGKMGKVNFPRGEKGQCPQQLSKRKPQARVKGKSG